jgi:hypothetical protein
LKDYFSQFGTVIEASVSANQEFFFVKVHFFSAAEYF